MDTILSSEQRTTIFGSIPGPPWVPLRLTLACRTTCLPFLVQDKLPPSYFTFTHTHTHTGLQNYHYINGRQPLGKH